MANFASGVISPFDAGVAVEADAVGNVYVTGSSDDKYATVKYDSSGTVQWVARYDGPPSGIDIPEALTIDAGGNVYVTGRSDGVGTLRDYATVKYNAEGVEQWAARYNGSGNSYDDAVAIGVDGDGSVYVTGSSYGAGTSVDYVTIKYDALGTEQWVRSYNGWGPDDYAHAMAVDISGNVYVTGGSVDSGARFNCVTIMYSKVGAVNWVARYNGPMNWNDIANDIALDDSGNVYITGESGAASGNSDYITVKYDPSGMQLWASIYSGPGAHSDAAVSIAVDNMGGAVVTGHSADSLGGTDCATIKYGPTGVEQWAMRYNGPAYGADYGTKVVLDASQSAFVSCYSMDTSGYNGSPSFACVSLKYDSSGSVEWIRKYRDPVRIDDRALGLALDGLGHVDIVGSSYGPGFNPDYLTIQYDTAGNERWAKKYDGPPVSNDGSAALVVDASGNVYITGSSLGGYLTVKYGASGVEEWVRRYNGTGNSVDGAVSIAADDSGNVYITGRSVDSIGGVNYGTLKYSSTGELMWVARYDGPAHGDDDVVALAIDVNGSVIVTGTSQGSGTAKDYATVKYDPAGVQQWVARYAGSSNDYASALALDTYGNVYVTGGSLQQVTFFDFASAFATVKYSASGIQEWVSRYKGAGVKDDYATALAVDGSGNVFVTGIGFDSNGVSSDFVTVKYDSSGAEHWVVRYDGPVHGDDEARGIGVSAGGSIYVVGHGYGLGTSLDVAVVKYSPEGAELWATRFDGPGNAADHVSDMVLDQAENIDIVGDSYPPGGNGDYQLVRCDSSGTITGTARFDGPTGENDFVQAIAVDDGGGIYVTGASAFASGQQVTTIKYGQSTTDVVAPEDRPLEFALRQNYPNPFNPQTLIQYVLPTRVRVNVSIFNVLGQEVARLVDEIQEAGVHMVSWHPDTMPSGVYFCRIIAGEFTQTRKLLLMR